MDLIVSKMKIQSCNKLSICNFERDHKILGIFIFIDSIVKMNKCSDGKSH